LKQILHTLFGLKMQTSTIDCSSQIGHLLFGHHFSLALPPLLLISLSPSNGNQSKPKQTKFRKFTKSNHFQQSKNRLISPKLICSNLMHKTGAQFSQTLWLLGRNTANGEPMQMIGCKSLQLFSHSNHFSHQSNRHTVCADSPRRPELICAPQGHPKVLMPNGPNFQPEIAQILSNSPKFSQILSNSPKFAQIRPNSGPMLN